MVPVVPNLWLCDHASYGSLSNLKGAEDEARRILGRWGGYRKLRDELDEKAKAEHKARLEAKAAGRARMAAAIKDRT
jgi:hypothetical protein